MLKNLKNIFKTKKKAIAENPSEDLNEEIAPSEEVVVSPSGNNWSRGDSPGYKHTKKKESIDYLQSPCFEILPEVAQRFNTYAQAAFPMEIGGLLRLVWNEDKNLYQAVDIKILEQKVTPVYFEMDSAALASFNLELVKAGRGKEISEWRCLIHSHPNMTTFMSGVDRDNLRTLAGDEWAFSVICSARANSADNYYAVHYTQVKPLALTVQDIYLGGGELAGNQLIPEDEREAIRQEVLGLCFPSSTMTASVDKLKASNESTIAASSEDFFSPVSEIKDDLDNDILTTYDEDPHEAELELFDSYKLDGNSSSLRLASMSKQAKGYISAAELTESQYEILDEALDTDMVVDIYEDEVLGQARAELNDWLSPQSTRILVIGLSELRDHPPEHFDEDQTSEVISLLEFFSV